MPYPGDIDALNNVRQDADGTATQVAVIPGSPYRVVLGASATGDVWRTVPPGAYPVALPAAPIFTRTLTSPRGGLTANGHYQYALSDITDIGETGIGAILDVPGTTLGTDNAIILQLPALAETTTVNPVRYRWLCRTQAGGLGLLRVMRIYNEQVSVTDVASDQELLDAAPTTNTSGAIGVVTVTGGGYGSWTEKAWGTTLAGGQFAVNYDVASGGILQFAATDTGKTITITYTAATVLDETLVGSFITALRSVRAALGTAPQGGAGSVDARVGVMESDLASYYGVSPNTTPAHAIKNLYADVTSTHFVRGRGVLIGGGRYYIAPVDNSVSAHALVSYDLTGMGSAALTPPAPTLMTTVLPTGFVPQALDAYGHYVVVVGANATGTNVAVLDASRPGAPVSVASLALLKEAYDVQVIGRYAVVAANTTIVVLDLANPTMPTVARSISSGAMTGHCPGCLIGSGYVAVPYHDAHRTFIIDPQAGTIVTTINDTTNCNSPAGCAAIDDHLVITNNLDDSTIRAVRYDLVGWPSLVTGSPRAVFALGVLHAIGYPSPIIAAGRYLVIGGQAGSGSLTILDATDPAVLSSVYQAVPAGLAIVTSFSLAGRHLIVGHVSGVSVYDLSSKDVDALRAGSLEAGRVLVDDSLLVQRQVRAGSAVIGRGGAAIDGDAAVAGAFSLGGSLIDTGVGTGLSVAAGAALGAGGSFVAPAFQAGSTPRRGRITWTTGTAPTTDAVALTVTLPAAYVGGFAVLVTPVWVAPAGWTIADAGYGTQHNGVGGSLTAWGLNVRNALQANTAYALDYWLIG